MQGSFAQKTQVGQAASEIAVDTQNFEKQNSCQMSFEIC